MNITNVYDIPFPLQLWLVDNDYDYINDPKYISATTLLKPIKQIILSSRAKDTVVNVDVSEYISRALGTTIHAGIEKAWKQNYKQNLKFLGYPENMINNVKINPEPEEITEDTFPIYLEKRSIKSIGGFKVGGKFDFVVDNAVNDFKTTKVYTYISGSNEENYVKQGSIYRWLNPDIITEDYIRINYIFTDWQKIKTYDPTYPQCPIVYKDYPLLSLADTEEFILNKLNKIKEFFHKDEEDIPPCSDKDLWRDATKYKYYINPTNLTRATKNFNNIAEATEYKISKGNKGIIKPVVGTPRRCLYCNAFNICQQRKEYFNDFKEAL